MEMLKEIMLNALLESDDRNSAQIAALILRGELRIPDLKNTKVYAMFDCLMHNDSRGAIECAGAKDKAAIKNYLKKYRGIVDSAHELGLRRLVDKMTDPAKKVVEKSKKMPFLNSSTCLRIEPIALDPFQPLNEVEQPVNSLPLPAHIGRLFMPIGSFHLEIRIFFDSEWEWTEDGRWICIDPHGMPGLLVDMDIIDYVRYLANNETAYLQRQIGHINSSIPHGSEAFDINDGRIGVYTNGYLDYPMPEQQESLTASNIIMLTDRNGVRFNIPRGTRIGEEMHLVGFTFEWNGADWVVIGSPEIGVVELVSMVGGDLSNPNFRIIERITRPIPPVVEEGQNPDQDLSFDPDDPSF